MSTSPTDHSARNTPAGVTDVTTRIDPGRSFDLAARHALKQAQDQLSEAVRLRDEFSALVERLNAEVQAIATATEAFHHSLATPSAKRKAPKRGRGATSHQPLLSPPSGEPAHVQPTLPTDQADQADPHLAADPAPPPDPTSRQAAYTRATGDTRRYGQSAAIYRAVREYVSGAPAGDHISPRLLADHLARHQLVDSVATGLHYAYTILASLTNQGTLLRIAPGRYRRTSAIPAAEPHEPDEPNEPTNQDEDKEDQADGRN